MTTLYDLIAGQNPYSRMALAILALDMDKVPRYRDAMLFRPDDTNAQWTVGILTRCGGPNRSHFDLSTLTDHPLYLSDCDLKRDETYATFNFKFPSELSGLGRWIVNTEPLEGDDRIDAWVSLFNKLNQLKQAFPDSPYVVSMKKWIAPVMQQLVDSGKIDVVDVS